MQHAYYKHYVFVNEENLTKGWNRDLIIDALNQLGVPCMQGSCSEVYLEKAFDDTDFKPKNRLPVAKKLGETSIMFMVHPTLKEEEMDFICETVQQILVKASI